MLVTIETDRLCEDDLTATCHYSYLYISHCLQQGRCFTGLVYVVSFVCCQLVFVKNS